MTEELNKVISLFKETAYKGFTANPASPEEIVDAENKLGACLPESYKGFQLEVDDTDWAMLEIYSVKSGITFNIVDATYSERTEYFPNMPQHLIPFSNNGGGDSYCFDTSSFENGECKVVFWDHTDSPEQQPKMIAINFLEWIKQEIKWRLDEDA